MVPRQACLMDAMRNTVAEFIRDDGQSEFGGVEGSAAVGGRPARAGPTAVGDSPGGAAPTAVRETLAEAGLVRDTATAVRETILRDGSSHNFGAIGRGETAVPVEVGPERDQPD